MGKTLGNILLIGAAVAINFIPGVGQAISGALVSTVGIGGATVITGAITAAGISAGISTVAGAFTGGGLQSSKPETTSTAIKTSRAPRVSAYGRCRLYGAYILYETTGSGQAIDIYAVHDGLMDGLELIYLGDDQVTIIADNVQPGADGRYAGDNLQFYYTDGSVPGVGIPNAEVQLPGIWSSNHRGDGIVLMSLFCGPVKADDFLDVYPNGVPVPSIVSRWQLCPDPFATDPTDPTGWTWTENVIRQLLHYKMVREGVDYATKIAPTIAYWQAASLVCDEAIPLKAGGTEPRWRSCISHKHTDKNGTVTDALLAACDGWIAPRSDGALVVYAGKYYAPTVSIGAAQIVAYDWSYGVDDDQAVNELICSYVSADHDYNSVECDAWRDEDDIARRGRVLSDGLDPQVPSWGQVRRLAKRRMARTNALYRGTVTTNIAGRIVRGQRYINLDLTEAGTTFYSGPVEITTLTRNIATGGVSFSWVAASASIDAWNAATEEGDPAAKGDRVALEPLATPAILSASPTFFEYGAQIQISVDGPDRPDATWYTRWKVSTDVAWTEQTTTDLDSGSPVLLATPIVPLNVMVDVEVAYGVGDGRTSNWSATETIDTTAP